MRFNPWVHRSLMIAAVSLLSIGAAQATNTTATPTPTKRSAKSSSSSHKSSRSKKSTTSGKTTSSKSKKSKSTKNTSAKATSHGQHGIDPARTREIQDALSRYQEANGWQTKSLPDSRALIKLGLGPDKKGLLNPDTASMSSPHELGTPHETVPGGSAQQ